MKTIDDALQAIKDSYTREQNVYYEIFRASTGQRLHMGKLDPLQPLRIPGGIYGDIDLKVYGDGYKTLELKNFYISHASTNMNINIPLLIEESNEKEKKWRPTAKQRVRAS